MRITVLGLGYVGCVSAACLADHGHEVTGVDIDETKVSLINAGRSPIVEPGLEEVIQRVVKSRRLRAMDKAEALGDVVMVCIGTPSNKDGSLGLSQIVRVVGDIGELVEGAQHNPIIAIRSTVLPGTVEQFIVPILEERSGKTCGKDFGVCMNPDFMRETTAVEDFADPPFTVIGAGDRATADRVAEVYAKLAAPVEKTSIREAEMIKYACNAFHAAKVCFANEIGNLSKHLGIDGHRVMSILCRDEKLNLSPYYMVPGFAFGGSCLPKDLRAIVHQSKQLDVDLPMLKSLLETNHKQIERAIHMVRRTGKTKIGVLGLSFKAGTDDLRESPTVALIETLIGEGYTVSIYDEEVSLARLHGANRRYIEHAIPQISSLMTSSIAEVLNASEVIVVSKQGVEFANKLKALPADRIVIDLVRLVQDGRLGAAKYEGICW